MGYTIAEKIIKAHLISGEMKVGEEIGLKIDQTLTQDATGTMAYLEFEAMGIPQVKTERSVAYVDHNTLQSGFENADDHKYIQTVAAKHGVYFSRPGNGICHQVHYERFGIPGKTLIGSDSHTPTGGGLGMLAMGAGGMDVAVAMGGGAYHIPMPRMIFVELIGELRPNVSAKDIILAIIAKIGTNGAQGHVIEYRGRAIERLSMEARMTICNMSIEAGARAGMIAPDQTTFDYVYGRELAPTGDDWDKAVAYWKTLPTDEGATFDTEITIDGSALTPFVTWGTNPGQGLPLNAVVPSPDDFTNENDKKAAEKALTYMGLTPGTPLRDIKIDTVFLGSCTNARIEDLRTAAHIMKGHKVADTVRMMVVPSTTMVKQLAEAEGLDKIFTEAGADWRSAGCSMCLGMNPDQLKPGERSASTSNRNFEGRQGPGGRTHLVSPEVAAATAIMGTLASPADLPTYATS